MHHAPKRGEAKSQAVADLEEEHHLRLREQAMLTKLSRLGGRAPAQDEDACCIAKVWVSTTRL